MFSFIRAVRWESVGGGESRSWIVCLARPVHCNRSPRVSLCTETSRIARRTSKYSGNVARFRPAAAFSVTWSSARCYLAFLFVFTISFIKYFEEKLAGCKTPQGWLNLVAVANSRRISVAIHHLAPATSKPSRNACGSRPRAAAAFWGFRRSL